MKRHRAGNFNISLLVICVLTAISIAFGQEPPRSQEGCAYLDKERPSLFISYVRELTEKGGKGRPAERVLLRLHNNSSCSFNIETDDMTGDESLFRKEVTKLPNGDIGTTYIPDPPEGARLSIFYDIQASKTEAPKPANYPATRDIAYTYTVPPGRSVVFAVDAKYFKKQYILSIPYSYSWEEIPERNVWGSIQHRVLYFYELPEGFLKG